VPRRVRWHSVPLTTAEQNALAGLGRFERAVLGGDATHEHAAAWLLLSVFRKRALSSMGALVDSLERRIMFLESCGDSRRDHPDAWWQPRLGALDDEDGDEAGDATALRGESGLTAQHECSWLRRLHDLARAAARDESKVRWLSRLLDRTTEPVVIFTEFRDSLHVVLRNVQRVRPAAILHGGLTSDEQQDQLDRFRSGAVSVLLATDVGSQGLNLQAGCRWVLNLELPWNPARLEQRAGRVDRIGQHRRVHIGLLVARHEAEAGLLRHLAQRTLQAERRFGDDLLQFNADEARVRAHLLGGIAFSDPDPPARPIALCRSWNRPARAAARQLGRQRALGHGRRLPDVMCRPGWSRFRRLCSMGGGSAPGVLLCFSVPMIDGCGALAESRLVVVRVEGPVRGSRWSNTLEQARRVALASAVPRARRLQRLQGEQSRRAGEVEQALAEVLVQSHRRGELQPGLFDRRSVREQDQQLQLLSDIQEALKERLSLLASAASIEVGSPRLDLVMEIGA